MAVSHEVKGDKLIITVDLNKKEIQSAKPSATGRTKIVASTRGNTKVGEFHGSSIAFALNVMAKDA